MDWKKLYLNANGRIGQKDFWLGLLILIVVAIVLSVITAFIPVVNALVSLAILYPAACLYSKRLHDMGKTGWLAAIPCGISGALTLMTLFTSLGMLAVAGGSSAGAAGAMAGAAGLGMFGVIGGLISLAFLLWVGLTKGDAGENQYGPPPTPLIGGATTTPAA